MKRKHEVIYKENNKFIVDVYPEIDCHIPEAERLANQLCKNKKSVEWTQTFMDAMDYLTCKNGVRILSRSRIIKLEKVFGNLP